MNIKISIHGTILAMALAILGSQVMAQSNCDPKVDVCLIAGKNYFSQRQISGADALIKEENPKHDFRIAFWVKVANPISDKKTGDSCNFADGAKVHVVRKFKDHDGYLVKYLGGANVADACPVGSYTQVAGIPLFAFKTTKNVEDESRRILESRKM